MANAEEEVRQTRLLADQARQIFEELDEPPRSAQEWLDRYTRLEEFRKEPWTLPLCRKGWSRSARMCKTCGSPREHLFFEDRRTWTWEDETLVVSLSVAYVGSVLEHRSYTWRSSVNHQSSTSTPLSSSISGYAETHDQASLLAEQGGEKLLELAKAQVKLQASSP